MLNSLVESLPTARILLLVNYRPEYQHTWGSKTYYSQLRLDPLAPESAEALLQTLLGDDSSLAPLTPVLITRTEGNPFFLEESVRTLVETQVLVGERGAYRLAQALPSIQVPATVQAVLAACGHGAEGITQIQQGLAASQAIGTVRDRPYHLALFAEASAQVGRTTEGLEALAEALATLPKSGARWWEAELYRLRGELLLQHAVAQPGEAEACFQQALAVARRQQTKSLELRAAMSLSSAVAGPGQECRSPSVVGGDVRLVHRGV